MKVCGSTRQKVRRAPTQSLRNKEKIPNTESLWKYASEDKTRTNTRLMKFRGSTRQKVRRAPTQQAEPANIFRRRRSRRRPRL